MSELRRHIMMQQGVLDCFYLTFDVEYIGTNNRRCDVYWYDRILFSLKFSDPALYRCDLGIFNSIPVNRTPNNSLSIYPCEEYKYRGTTYQYGDYFEYFTGDIVVDNLYFINQPKKTELKYDFVFDYNGGGDNRRMRFGMHGFPMAEWTYIDGWGTFSRPVIYDFYIERISASIDYFGIKALRPFECEGVVYNIGDTMLVPWLSPMSTLIYKTITMI